MNDVTIQLYLRNLMIDKLATIAPGSVYSNANVMVVYDNYDVPKKTDGIIIQEFYDTVFEHGYSSFEKGSGIYELVVCDNRATGLRYRKFCNELKNAFIYGIYNVDNNTTINITDVRIEASTYKPNDEKVYSSVLVIFNKFYNYYSEGE